MLNYPVFVLKSGILTYSVKMVPVPAPSSHEHPQKGYLAKGVIGLPWKLGLRTNISRKSKASSSNRIILFNSCNNSLFAGTTLTLHKS